MTMVMPRTNIYADAGITGTSIEKRDEFRRMLADCRAGKIRRVLVKFVSRFARNTLELLETTRELKELGVVIVFEEQGIDTSQMLGEMQLTMFALAAQEESTSTSKNIRRSYQMRMERGTYITNYAPYGYRLVNGALSPHPSESQAVKHIFDLYLAGNGLREIVRILNDENIPPRRGDCWKISSISYILSNEKYFGDALLQKKVTTDTLSHRRDRNRGQEKQFYLTESQEAVISRETFLQAQKIALSRQKCQARAPHLFTHRILCPDCGRHFRHVMASGKSYWLCPYSANGVSDCTTIRIPECKIISASLHMLSKLFLNQNDLLSPTLSLLHEIEYTQTGSDSKLYELDKAIADLNDKALVLQRLQNKGFITAKEFRTWNDALAAQRVKLTAERKRRSEERRVGKEC